MEQKPIKVIKIPPNCSIRRRGNTIEIYDSHCKGLSEEEVRCKDCFWRQLGYSTSSNPRKTLVCFQKPKKAKNNGEPVYFHIEPYDKVCDKFKKR